MRRFPLFYVFIGLVWMLLALSGAPKTARAQNFHFTGSMVLPPADVYPLEQARSEHKATLLTNGQVLVTGGSNGYRALTSCELFDPATGL